MRSSPWPARSARSSATSSSTSPALGPSSATGSTGPSGPPYRSRRWSHDRCTGRYSRWSSAGMLAAAIAFVLEYLRNYNKVRDERDLEERTGLPALGSVAEKRGDIRRGASARLVMLRHPGSDAAEVYRGLLARIGFSSGTARTLMVTSADPPTARASWPRTWRSPTPRPAATSSSSMRTTDHPHATPSSACATIVASRICCPTPRSRWVS